MMMRSMCKKVVVFDLDDTLYKEIDFLRSAYKEIATSVGHPELAQQMFEWYKKGDNAFKKLNQRLGKNTPIEDYLSIYRNHFPSIRLIEGVEDTLDELRYRGNVLGLITDGRSISQRNKIKALGLERWIDEKDIIISEEFGSEKTDGNNFRYFNELYPDSHLYYVGDNPMKDFVVPNSLHWKTIMLKDDGRNIHPQKECPEGYSPQIVISDFDELLDL